MGGGQRHRRTAALAALFAGILLVGCAYPPPAPPPSAPCLLHCARQKDACLLHAINAQQVQFCDQLSAGCNQQCVPR